MGPVKRPIAGFNVGPAASATVVSAGGKRGRYASGGTTPVHEMQEESSMAAPDLTVNQENTLGHSTLQLSSSNLGTPALSSTMMQERFGRGPPKHRAGKKHGRDGETRRGRR